MKHTTLTTSSKLSTAGSGRSNRALLALLIFFTWQGFTSRAATHLWTGGGGANRNWNAAANWTGGAPVVGEAAPVTLIFTNGVLCTNNIPGLVVDALRFTNAPCVIHGGAGGTLTFRGAGGTNLYTWGVYGMSNVVMSTLPITISGTNLFCVSSSHTFNIQSVISGTGTVALNGGGYLRYSGTQPNTCTGTNLILSGVLELGKTAGVNAIAGPVIVGDENFGDFDETLALVASEQIPTSVPLIFRPRGYFFLHGFTETVGVMYCSTAYIDTQGGLLILSSNVVGRTDNVASTQIIGRLSLGGATRTFDITNSAYIGIDAVITNGPATAGIIKIGGGELTLKGTNTYTGATTINEGSLTAIGDQALGSSSANVSVASNAMLTIQNANLGARPLTLGGLLYTIGTNIWAGTVTLLPASSVQVGGPSDLLTISSSIGGTGSLLKKGSGTLVLSGNSANTYSGGTTVIDGRLKLNKTGVIAVPGTLVVGDGGGAANSDIVQLLQANQIADPAAVTIANTGWLDLNSNNETIGSLAGSGTVSLGAAALTTGGSNGDTSYAGVISGAGATALVKNRSGAFTLGGNNTCSGTTVVNAGKLIVNGVLPGPVSLANSSTVGGSGTVGNVAATAGKVGPGNSVGRLFTGNFALNNVADSLEIELNGTTPGTSYDQVSVTGSVNLTGATLNLNLGFPGAQSNQFVIIDNDGADAVSGTFAGLPEGATLLAGGVSFTISYHGGTGNDVVLTQTSGAPPQIGNIVRLGNGQMQFGGTGIPGTLYTVQANTNLCTTNWIAIGSAPADAQTGAWQFTDVNAPNFPRRFYRLLAP